MFQFLSGVRRVDGSEDDCSQRKEVRAYFYQQKYIHDY